MSGTGNAELAGLLERQLDHTERIFAALEKAMAEDVPALGRSGNAAVMVAGLVENWYTCLETAWLRISQHFENHLDEGRWHADLLHKMTVRIEGVRIPAVSDANFPAILEIQKFRHFRRYYFELEYDWDRIDFLVKKLRQAHPVALADLRRFREFLAELDSAPDDRGDRP
jgi:hypothetical protein